MNTGIQNLAGLISSQMGELVKRDLEDLRFGKKPLIDYGA